MQFRPLFSVLLAPVAVSAACTGRPCRPDAIINLLKNPQVAEPASSLCSAYNQPTTTAIVTPTETVTQWVSQTIPGETFTATATATVTNVITQYTTSYSTVTIEMDSKRKRDLDFGPLTGLSQFPSSQISSACSCLVQIPSPALTVTETAAAVTATASSMVYLPGEEGTITVTETATESRTTVVTTVIPTQPPATAPQCTAKNFCCQNVAQWATNSGVWGGICGYYPSNPRELVGAGLGSQARTVVAPLAHAPLAALSLL
ncbi:hypothetical protein NEMBOFW57_009746 [Staphylotrichum longicolle]|uniref:Uncharacterized protein n=1 Tax=Staphylotrichum longicolle TaxID=669026 RepID=A0AAD4EQ02_9PEZI|nr:hypothetical protein NEMBOFW57_009746 [Staphylotrichum longicolle]